MRVDVYLVKSLWSLRCGRYNGSLIPGTGEPGGLPSMGGVSHRVGHD